MFQIERKISRSLLDLAEPRGLTAHSCCDGRLAFAPPSSKFRYGQTEDLSWRFKPPRIVSANRFSHTAIVADGRLLI
jgi:hypothetical protein